MKEKKLTSLLGLAQKAGKIVSGELAVEKAVRAGKAKIVVVASDSSESTKKNYHDMAAYYKIPIYEGLSKQQMGLCIGKANRAVVAIIDEGFSRIVADALLQ
ncbi:MAG: ribosomal L7Ae/L30e/S12e/Gadd45 family protein [Veillonellales bacterium]